MLFLGFNDKEFVPKIKRVDTFRSFFQPTFLQKRNTEEGEEIKVLNLFWRKHGITSCFYYIL